jgi:hypothetical protein
MGHRKAPVRRLRERVSSALVAPARSATRASGAAAGHRDRFRVLPGHGGWLDRLDSSLFAMPVVYIYVLRPWSTLALW